MKKHVLILEDLEIARKTLTNIVGSCMDDIVVHAFSSAGEAYECALEQKIDLFLVDIVLKPSDSNDFSGISFARNIRSYGRYLSSEIIFITTLAGLEADLLREVHCFDYIEKPIDPERVKKAVRQALRKLEKQDEEDELIFLRKDRISYPVFTKEIIFAISRHKVLYVHKKEDVIEVPNLSLKRFLSRIHTQKFLMPTKGAAVNIRYIEYIDTTNRFVKMRGVKEPVDIGARLKNQFIQAFNAERD